MAFDCEYLATPNSNLVCSICRVPFTDPHTTRTCSHTFCKGCILQALAYASYCPIDRSPLAAEDIAPADPIIRMLVEELVVKCPNTDCTHTAQRQLIPSHLRECAYTRIACGDSTCKLLVSRKDSKPEECTHSKATSSETDIARSTECPHSTHGCSWIGEATHISLHLAECLYQSSPINPFFALNDARIAALSDQNHLLKHRVDMLEGIVQNMGKELATVKLALGPWYRHNILLSSGLNMTTSSSDLPTEVQPTSAGPSHAHNPMIAAETPMTSTSSLEPSFPSSVVLPNASQPMQDPDVLASYFPPENTPVRPPLRGPSGASFQDTSIQSFSPYTRPIQPPYVPPHQQSLMQQPQYTTTVAPLNLSTSLPGTLASLRESVVGVSSAVDSLARRNELALTSEGLRVNEEMMGLRANLHGLRMQVHAIMVDRNAQTTGRTGMESIYATASGSRGAGNTASITKL